MTEFDRLTRDLLKEFCESNDETVTAEGFRDTSHKIAVRDKVDFVRAMKAGLVRAVRPGQYRAPRSCASEQFFWSGRKSITPRRITLWVEPIITVATLARLHFDFGWPAENLGTQSRRWGFDLCAYAEPIAEAGVLSSTMVIAGEIKKSLTELEDLIDLMKRFGAGHHSPSITASREINASRKVEEIRIERPMFFLAVGPDSVSYAFAVIYGSGLEIRFDQVSKEQLRFISFGRVKPEPERMSS